MIHKGSIGDLVWCSCSIYIPPMSCLLQCLLFCLLPKFFLIQYQRSHSMHNSSTQNIKSSRTPWKIPQCFRLPSHSQQTEQHTFLVSFHVVIDLCTLRSTISLATLLRPPFTHITQSINPSKVQSSLKRNNNYTNPIHSICLHGYSL